MYLQPAHGRDSVPPRLNTISRWRLAGYRVRSDAVPRATAEVGMSRDEGFQWAKWYEATGRSCHSKKTT